MRDEALISTEESRQDVRSSVVGARPPRLPFLVISKLPGLACLDWGQVWAQGSGVVQTGDIDSLRAQVWGSGAALVGVARARNGAKVGVMVGVWFEVGVKAGVEASRGVRVEGGVRVEVEGEELKR